MNGSVVHIYLLIYTCNYRTCKTMSIWVCQDVDDRCQLVFSKFLTSKCQLPRYMFNIEWKDCSILCIICPSKELRGRTMPSNQQQQSQPQLPQSTDTTPGSSSFTSAQTQYPPLPPGAVPGAHPPVMPPANGALGPVPGMVLYPHTAAAP